MKKILFILAVSFIANFLFAQSWDNLRPQNEEKKELRFQDFQKEFYDQWKDKDVKAGYYYENGIKKKAYGWKQFKRWEYFWEKRINQQTGKFPTSKDYDIAKEQYVRALNERNTANRSSSGNWKSLGPESSRGGYQGVGRINQIAFHPTNSKTFWVTTPGGGLWVTKNSGSTWKVLTDDIDNLATSAIAIPSDYSSSKTIYLGSGERDSWRHDNGIGLLKSTDAGETWKKTGLKFNVEDGIVVNKILIHPDHNSILYAATTNGIYKSNNSAKNWSKIYSKKYISDIEFKPGDPSVIYASNKYWGEIYKLTSNGTNVTKIYDEYSFGGKRVELAISPSKPNDIYALVSNGDGGLYEIAKSTDSGVSFSALYKAGAPPSKSKPNILSGKVDGDEEGGQGWFDLSLIVDPSDPKIMYCGGVNTWKSTDGGKSWKLNNFWTGYYCSSCEIVHADKHSLAFNSNTLYECNDGGLYKTTNGKDWTNISNGIVNSQMYKLGVSQMDSKDVITGLQDNGSKNYSDGEWKTISGGDGMECLIDYKNNDIQYSETQSGTDLYRTTNHWYSKQNIEPDDSEGAWVTPFIIDPKNHNTLYAGYQHIYKSTNKGDTWKIIFEQNSSDKFRCLAISPSDTKVIYASEPKTLWKTTNGGTNWSKISNSLPDENITSIAVKYDDPKTVWITFGGFDKYVVYQTTNGGSTWKNISKGLPYIPANSIVQNKQNTTTSELYVGTDFGVYLKLGNSNWQLFNTGLPKVVVEELDIFYSSNHSRSKLRAATYGRGLWESDLHSIADTPVADFSADNTTINKGETVNFSDLSLNTPTSWSWEFEGGSPATSTDQNPSVVYNDAGVFKVKLTVSNSLGSNTETKEGYITVSCGKLEYSSANAVSLEGTYSDLGTDGDAIITDNFDDANSEPVDIGFDFEFNCISFNQFVLNTNGFIKLGNKAPSKTSIFFSQADNSSNGIFNSDETNIISAFNHDLQGGANAEYRIYTSGASPNKICTIQFKGLKEKTTSPAIQYDEIEFQIKLYESSNVIEFVYGDWTESNNSSSYKTSAVGLKGASYEDDQIIVVSKNSRGNWGNVKFSNKNYSYNIPPFNFGNPPDRPKPDKGRTLRFLSELKEDLYVKEIYSFGENSIYHGNPQEVSAVIINNGKEDVNNIEVELEITLSNEYKDTLVIPTLIAGDTAIVTFEGINLTNIGRNDIRINLPDDDFVGNNTKKIVQQTTNYIINYSSDETPTSGWGYNYPYEGIFAVKYFISGKAKIEKVNVHIFNYSENVGQEVYAVLMDGNGTIVAQSESYTLQNYDLGKYFSFSIADSPTFDDETVIAGLVATKSNSGSAYYPMSVQNESPSRLDAYFNSSINGGTLWEKTSDFEHRYMVGITTIPSEAIPGTANANNEYLCNGEKTYVQLLNYNGDIQWEQSEDGNSDWKKVTGGNGAHLAIYNTPSLENDIYYRAKVSFGNSTKYSNIVHIFVYPDYSFNEEFTICKGESFTFPDASVEENIDNTIQHTSKLKTIFGCDSIINTTILVDKLDLSITVIENDTTLVANANDVIYQWINCDDNTAINGENNKSFTPFNTGNFGVIIADDICKDTSECVYIIGTSIDDSYNSDIKIYPNPTNNNFIVDFSSTNANITSISIVDVSGKKLGIYAKNLTDKTIKIDVENINIGLYFVKIKIYDKTIYKKLIIER